MPGSWSSRHPYVSSCSGSRKGYARETREKTRKIEEKDYSAPAVARISLWERAAFVPVDKSALCYVIVAR